MSRFWGGVALFSVILMAFVGGWAQEDRLDAANAAYLAGDYNTAILTYEAIIREGRSSGVVYFNLGSAYYQSDALGDALLNFRRAQQFIPRDSDLNTALGVVRGERDDLQGDELALLDRTATLTTEVLTYRELSGLVVFFWTGLGLLGGTVVLRPGWRQVVTPLLVVLGVFGVGLAGLWANRAFVDRYRPAAMVTEETTLYSGVDTDYLELFRLGPAAELRIVERRDEWSRVLTPDDRQGWLPARAVTTVLNP